MMRRRTFTAGLGAAALAGCATAQARRRAFDAAHVDGVLQGLVARGEIVGISALVFQGGHEAYFGAFGYADREARRPMARDAIAQIYSMTKPITGVALMTLYEEGKFQLDDPIAAHAPELADLKVCVDPDASGAPVLAPPRRAPTIRDFTRHTAGLTDRSGANPAVDRPYREADPMNLENTLMEMARRLGRVPLLYQPGERWLYGDSVDVQAFLVERFSGQSFADYLRARVFTPLAMNETGYVVPESERGRMAAIYERAEDGTFARRPDAEAFKYNFQSWPLTPGGWGLASTLDDYMRFARMLLNEGALDGARVLRPETVRLMATNQLPDSVTNRSWLPNKGQVGFGIDFAVRLRPPASADENHGSVGEFFWDGAASTLFWVDPANELVAVMFVQIMPFDPIHLHRTFRRAIYDALVA